MKIKTDVLGTIEAATKADIQKQLNHGADAGWTGFIYYSDTCKFFDDNKDLILQQLEDDANEFGEDMLTMISHFNCLTDNNRKPIYTYTEIMNAIYDVNDENETIIKNALAWYALETVAFQLAE